MAAHCSHFDSGSRTLLLPSLFRFDCNRPDKAQQFEADGGDDLRLVLASCKQLFITGAEPPLGLPGNRFGFLIQTLLPLGEPACV